MSEPKKIRSLPHDTVHQVRVGRTEEGFRVTCEDPALDAIVLANGSSLLTVTTEAGSFEATVERDEDEMHVTVGHERFVFATSKRRDGSGNRVAGGAGRAELKAPMPGKIVQLLVNLGDSVRAGQGLLLFEAMKMQNEIRAPSDGFVVELSVEEGQAVEAREPLLVLDRSRDTIR